MESQIIRAIRERLVIEFDYNDLHRVVEPHLLGETVNGVALSAFQIGGQSSRGTLPDWVLCYLDDVQNLVVTTQKFSRHPDFNAGDKKFRSVKSSVDSPL
jgi:hypothetical protein